MHISIHACMCTCIHAYMRWRLTKACKELRFWVMNEWTNLQREIYLQIYCFQQREYYSIGLILQLHSFLNSWTIRGLLLLRVSQEIKLLEWSIGFYLGFQKSITYGCNIKRSIKKPKISSLLYLMTYMLSKISLTSKYWVILVIAIHYFFII